MSYQPPFQLDDKKELMLLACSGDIAQRLYAFDTKPPAEAMETIGLLAGILGWWDLITPNSVLSWRTILGELNKNAGNEIGTWTQ